MACRAVDGAGAFEMDVVVAADRPSSCSMAVVDRAGTSCRHVDSAACVAVAFLDRPFYSGASCPAAVARFRAAYVVASLDRLGSSFVDASYLRLLVVAAAVVET